MTKVALINQPRLLVVLTFLKATFHQQANCIFLEIADRHIPYTSALCGSLILVPKSVQPAALQQKRLLLLETNM